MTWGKEGLCKQDKMGLHKTFKILPKSVHNKQNEGNKSQEMVLAMHITKDCYPESIKNSRNIQISNPMGKKL